MLIFVAFSNIIAVGDDKNESIAFKKSVKYSDLYMFSDAFGLRANQTG